MQRHVIHLDHGEVVEFTGELVAETEARTPRDARTVAVDVLRVYRTEDRRYVLVMERSVEVRSRTFCLHFNSVSDVADYVGREESLREAARVLARSAGDKEDTNKEGTDKEDAD